MTTSDQIADRTLPAEAQAAAGAILARQVELGTRALAAAQPAAPVCAAVLYEGQTELETDFSLPVIALGHEPWRRELLGRMTPYEAFRLLFNPEEGPGEWAEPEHDPMHEAGAVLVPALADAGVWDQQRWVLCRIARAMTLAPAPAPRTPDYVACLFDQDGALALTENPRFAAPARAHRRRSPARRRGRVQRRPAPVPRAAALARRACREAAAHLSLHQSP